MNISIGVVFHNEEKNLPACLKSLVEQNFVGHREIILVNNLSTDSSVKVIEDFFISTPGISWKIIKNKTNNLAAARNLVIDNATYDFIYYTDADCVVPFDTLAKLSDLFEKSKHGSIVAVGGSNIPPQTADSYLYQSLMCMQHSIFGNFNSTQMKIPTSEITVWHLPTCNLLYRKSILEKFRFDERFVVTGEDLEINLRLKKAGFKMIQHQDAAVIHRHRDSFWAWIKKSFKYGYGNGAMIYVNREIFKTHRLLPAAGFLIGLIMLMAFPLWTIVSAIIYGVILFFISFILARKVSKPKFLLGIYLWFLMLLTQISYALGQAYGTIKGL